MVLVVEQYDLTLPLATALLGRSLRACVHSVSLSSPLASLSPQKLLFYPFSELLLPLHACTHLSVCLFKEKEKKKEEDASERYRPSSPPPLFEELMGQKESERSLEMREKQGRKEGSQVSFPSSLFCEGKGG